MKTMPAVPAVMVMEHAEDSLAVPPLVDDHVLLDFARAVRRCAGALGSGDEAAAALCRLTAKLDNLRGLASLTRLALLGHPHAFARVLDEVYCLSVDFPDDPLGPCSHDGCCPDDPDDRVQLAAAIDLLIGASFVSKDDPDQRDRFIVGLVRAIEDAIAFPVVYSHEVAAYLGNDPTIAPFHASIVVANATGRLIEGDQKCVPQVPAAIRCKLECLARRWMRDNPVDAFFAAVSGPRIQKIVHWAEPRAVQPCELRPGDAVTLLLEPPAEDTDDCLRADRLTGLKVMFCPHQPATVTHIVEDGLQVEVPAGAATGPVAVLKDELDFRSVGSVLGDYAAWYPVEIDASVFAYIRMDVWTYPFAFGPPIVCIANLPQVVTVTAFTVAGQLQPGQTVAVGEQVAIHYAVQPPGSEVNAPLAVTCEGADVTPGLKPGVLMLTARAAGETTVEFAWGELTATVPIHVGGPNAPGTSEVPR